MERPDARTEKAQADGAGESGNSISRGGLADGKEENPKAVVTTNCKKSAEAIVPCGIKGRAEQS